MKKIPRKDVNPQYLELFPYYGRHGQDKFLNENFFSNKKNGVFVDIGAYDGVESSNTLFFEESNNWSGLCVEPLLNVFPKLQKNRTCNCLNACALDKTKKLMFQHIIPKRRKPLPNERRLSNIEKMSGLVEYSNEEYQKMIHEQFMKIGGRITKYPVQCVHVNTCLEMVGEKIDLLSIDTEGSELSILQAIDYSCYFIDVIIVEDLFFSSQLELFLFTKGYSFIQKIGYDAIYKKM